MAEPLAVYVHWPFCQAKCPYCDFNSHVRQGIDEARYGSALVRELTSMAEWTPGRRVTSIFFGGGTPSLMAPETVGAVLDAVGRLWAVEADAEITLEANPTSVEAARFRGYRAAGVNRVSLGIQALNDADLRALGRLHSAIEAQTAFDLARSIYPRVSFDLIYARAHQTLTAWEAELTAALALAADHLSLYQLTIEPGTAFGARAAIGRLPGLPDADRGADFYDLTQSLTGAAGLPAYEVSNHAALGGESRHNLVYWTAGDFVGVGPGAHGRFGAAPRRATETHLRPETWLTAVEAHGHGLTEETVLSEDAHAAEYLMMGLRLRKGLSIKRLRALGGLTPDTAFWEAEGLLTRNGDTLAATDRGRLVLNALISELMETVAPAA
ncbi:MAG: radical SAM family heme chaperone HemW [Pseudomonadota bacterium]